MRGDTEVNPDSWEYSILRTIMDDVKAGKSIADSKAEIRGDLEFRKQPSVLGQSAEQRGQGRVQRNEPLRCISLERPHRIGPDPDEPAQIALPDQITPDQSCRFPSTHAR